MARDHRGVWIGISKGKGKEGENCNRTACQEPESAHYYNTATNAYYCFKCALAIDEWAWKDYNKSIFDPPLPRGIYIDEGRTQS